MQTQGKALSLRREVLLFLTGDSGNATKASESGTDMPSR